MSNLKVVLDDEQFDSLLKEAGKDLVVIDFHTSWCRPCKTMDPVFDSLAIHYPKALFLKVDADKCFNTAMNYKVSGVPFFVIYRNKAVVSTVQGANQVELETKLRMADMESKKSNSSSSPSFSGNSNPNAVASCARLGCVAQYIDQANSHCFNDLSPSSFHNFLGGKKLISGKGSGKILLVYSFTKKLMLQSFKIKANSATGPKVLRIFVNHPKVLDFNAGSTLAPSQEVTLSEDDLLGERAIDLRSGSFQVVTNLQIFVVSGHGKGNKIEIDSLQLFGVPVHAPGQVIQQQVAPTECSKDSCNNLQDASPVPPCCNSNDNKKKGGKKRSKPDSANLKSTSSTKAASKQSTPNSANLDQNNAANGNNNLQIPGSSKNTLAPRQSQSSEKKERRSQKNRSSVSRGENEKISTSYIHFIH